MSNLSSTAQILSATSTDERHPAANVIDGNDKTFWLTTGGYPQEFVISWGGKEVTPTCITVVSRNVAAFTLLRCDKPEPKQWDEMAIVREVERKPADENQVTTKETRLKGPIRFIKLRIDAGYEEFAAISDVRVEG